MWGKLKQYLEPPRSGEAEGRPDQRLAVAAMLVEIARADFKNDEAEAATVAGLLGQHFGLNAGEAEQLMADAGARLDQVVSLHKFVDELNQQLGAEDKRLLMQQIWRVAYADGHLDAHEEHLARRISELLHISHEDFIREKLRVAPGAGGAL